MLVSCVCAPIRACFGSACGQVVLVEAFAGKPYAASHGFPHSLPGLYADAARNGVTTGPQTPRPCRLNTDAWPTCGSITHLVAGNAAAHMEAVLRKCPSVTVADLEGSTLLTRTTTLPLSLSALVDCCPALTEVRRRAAMSRFCGCAVLLPAHSLASCACKHRRAEPGMYRSVYEATAPSSVCVLYDTTRPSLRENSERAPCVRANLVKQLCTDAHSST